MDAGFYDRIPRFSEFSGVVDAQNYHPLPDDWLVGITDVVASTEAMRAGRYKAVNLAGASAISAVTNVMEGRSFPFVFCGDGAQFALAPRDAGRIATVMGQTAAWARRELSLDLRAALVPVADIRGAGFDVRIARYAASPAVDYTMFAGAGMAWAEEQVKSGRFAVPDTEKEAPPDLTGLSCQWGALRSQNGLILTLIVKPAGTEDGRFNDVVRALLTRLEDEQRTNPVPDAGPQVRWPRKSINLQGRTTLPGASALRRWLHTVASAALAWILFRTNLRIGGFDPAKYRRQISLNTDYRKFDDGLLLTVDCSIDIADALEQLLQQARTDGIVRYGLHRQDSALMTCVVPSIHSDSHLHFVDGANGGYALAAQQLKDTE